MRYIANGVSLSLARVIIASDISKCMLHTSSCRPGPGIRHTKGRRTAEGRDRLALRYQVALELLRGGFSCRRSKTIDGVLMKKVVVGVKEASHKQAPMNDVKNVRLGFKLQYCLNLLPNLTVSLA